MCAQADALIKLASDCFNLSESERHLLKQVAVGKEAIYLAEAGVEGDTQDDPSQADDWAESRTLRAEVLVWLCTNADASQFVNHWGIQIKGAKIKGSLDLQFATLPFPLICQRCAFTEVIRLDRATIKLLDLSGSYVASNVISVPGVEQEVQAAIEARGLRVESDVFLHNGFHATGCVSLLGATIGSNFSCNRGRFENTDGDALLAQSIEVKGDVFLHNGFHSTGRVSLAGAKIGSNLDCNQGWFENAGGDALLAQSIEVKGFVFLSDGFQAVGRVSFLGAKIGASLECTQCRFANYGSTALFAQNMVVMGNVFLCNGFHAVGRVSLAGATISGNLSCRQGRFENADGDALFAESIEVKGAVFLSDGFCATGCVSLYGARVGDSFECHKSRFKNGNKIALNAYSIEVKGSVSLSDGFEAEGRLLLQHAQIEDGLYLDSAMLAADSPTTEVDLRFARALTLADSEIIDRARWPQPGKLLLDGFTYEKLSPDSPTDSQYRLQWLRPQQGNGRFSPQPYTQLARVLQASGHEEATEILIGKQEAARHYGNLSRFKWFWNWFLGITIAHGYKPTRALIVSLAVIAFGTSLFHSGYRDGWIEASDLEAHTIATAEDSSLTYPEFFPLTYSLDVFLPVIDLHQASYWIPKASLGEPVDKNIDFLSTGIRDGGVLLAYFWLQIMLGWVLTSLWVAGFTGLVRRIE